jgi:hypothetical protein
MDAVGIQRAHCCPLYTMLVGAVIGAMVSAGTSVVMQVAS